MKFRDRGKIDKMIESAKICSEIFKKVIESTKEGVSLMELDKIAEEGCIRNNVIPAFKNYEGFPSCICTGVNDIVVHGIPDEYILTSGDIVSIDFGIKYKDVFSDMAKTVCIGEVPLSTVKFVNTVKEVLYAGINQAKPNNTVGDIGFAMQTVAERNGYTVVRELVGHGVGYKLHEEPNIPGYGSKGHGEKLYDGQTIAIEAIINEGKRDILLSSEDDWTTFTEDGMLSALFEHTVVVGRKPEILTVW